MEPRFVVGPPGTGKTHTYIVHNIKDRIAEGYDASRIVLLSHTNKVAELLLNAILKIKEIKEGEYDEEFFRDRICTIHHFCKSKLPKGREVIADNNCREHIQNLKRINTLFRHSKPNTLKQHSFFKFIKDAHGNGRSLEEHWNHPNTDKEEYSPYKISDLEKLEDVYKTYKGRAIYDFADMIDNFNDLNEECDIDVLMVDEAQDSNVPQMKALKIMAKNVKEEHFYLIGDPDQTIFEFAGSDADYFHKAAANPYHELKNGLRCGRAINTFCKKIIAPVWKNYGYERTWLPAVYNKEYHKIPEGCKEGDIIEGHKYDLTDLKPSKNLDILLDKMRNTKQTFVFAYRGYPSNVYITKFLKHHGFEFAHVGSEGPHVSKKELRCHKEWPEFIHGKPESLDQIKQFWKYLGREAIVWGKGSFKFEGWIKRDYTYTELVEAKLLKPNLNKSFDLLITGQKDHDDRMLYIKNVLRNGFDFNAKIRIEHGSIHIIKGTTFHNVVGDLSIYRKKPESFFIQRRLKYTMFSRGVFDCWVLRTSSADSRGLLGDYGPIPVKKSWTLDEDSFHREWRPDWNEIQNPINNDRRIT